VFLANAAFRMEYGADISAEKVTEASAWIPLAFGALILAPGFGLLALQSTILSPAKKGIVKEMVGSEKLGSASGILELGSVLALCVGQILSGFWFDSRMAETTSPWEAAYYPILILLIFSIPAYLVSHTMKVYPSPGKRRFKASIINEHVGQMRELLGDSKIRLSALGIGFFWFMGGFINVVVIQVANEITEASRGVSTGQTSGMGTELAYLLSAASGGMILGGAFASFSSRRSIELGLVPIGGILMVIGSSALIFVPTDGLCFKLWIGLTGFGASMFLVPLNAYLQDNCDEKKRGKVLAGLNLLDSITGASALGLFFGLLSMGMSINHQFIIIAFLCLAVTVFSTRLLPQHFVRYTIFYRQKVLNAERLPKEGGVLIVPNHVTYLDAFFLTASSSRPIRFLMYDSYFKKAGLVRFFIKFFDTVPISESRAKEAIQKAADAVAEGGVVCIFPEGQLTRSGCMNELKRGFEMIARKAKCPVVPVYMDGLWGSIFSFERGKFIYKKPYRLNYGVTIAWGEPMEAREATAVVVREKLSELSVESFGHRDVLKNPMKSACGGRVKVKEGSQAILQKLRSEVSNMSESKVHGLVYNALQVSEIHALKKKDTIALSMGELGDVKHVLAVILPRVGEYKVVLVDDSTTAEELKQWSEKHQIKNFFGGEKMRELLDKSGMNDVAIYSVNHSEASEKVYPIKVADERVVAMSMPHPIAVTATNKFQAGWKESSYGRVLPGYHVIEDGELDKIYDPQKGEALAEAPVDNEGFMLVG